MRSLPNTEQIEGVGAVAASVKVRQSAPAANQTPKVVDEPNAEVAQARPSGLQVSEPIMPQAVPPAPSNRPPMRTIADRMARKQTMQQELFQAESLLANVNHELNAIPAQPAGAPRALAPPGSQAAQQAAAPTPPT